MAGGKGNCLRPLASNAPKPMVPLPDRVYANAESQQAQAAKEPAAAYADPIRHYRNG